MTIDKPASPNRLEEDVALVTGSTSGIGAGIAKRLAVEDASVVSGRTRAEGETVVGTIRENGGRAVFVRADMREQNDIEQLVTATIEEYGLVTTVVNNAAVQTDTTLSEATFEDWQFVLETDFRTYWLTVKYVPRTRGVVTF